MSVDRRDYIIYGWKLPYNMKNRNNEKLNLWDDKFLPLVEGHKNEEFRIIQDQMCGKYTVFGYKVMSNDDGWEFKDIVFNDSFNYLKLKNRYVELFDNEIPETEPTLFIFSHFC